MTDQRLRHRRAAIFVRAEMSMEQRRIWKIPRSLPFEPVNPDPGGVVLAFANEAVERQMKPCGWGRW